MDKRQVETMQIMKDILQNDYIHFTLYSYQISEYAEDKESQVRAELRSSSQMEPIVIDGTGFGAVNAFFVSLREFLGQEYPSVRAIIFESIQAKNIAGSDRDHPTDAEGEVQIRVRNSYNDSFEFSTRSRSLLRACLNGLLKAFEYFVNSERTYVRIYKALEHYQKEGRSDLIDKYTALLGIVVRNTSYIEVSERIKHKS
jgi:hypothetical protein